MLRALRLSLPRRHRPTAPPLARLNRGLARLIGRLTAAADDATEPGAAACLAATVLRGARERLARRLIGDGQALAAADLFALERQTPGITLRALLDDPVLRDTLVYESLDEFASVWDRDAALTRTVADYALQYHRADAARAILAHPTLGHERGPDGTPRAFGAMEAGAYTDPTLVDLVAGRPDLLALRDPRGQHVLERARWNEAAALRILDHPHLLELPTPDRTRTLAHDLAAWDTEAVALALLDRPLVLAVEAPSGWTVVEALLEAWSTRAAEARSRLAFPELDDGPETTARLARAERVLARAHALAAQRLIPTPPPQRDAPRAADGVVRPRGAAPVLARFAAFQAEHAAALPLVASDGPRPVADDRGLAAGPARLPL